MDTVNKTLLLSLQQEVKTLNGIIKDVPTINNVEGIMSWLFPTKPYYFVTELVYSDEILKVESLKTYLELIIDRLYVGIRLILNYVEEKTDRRLENRFIHTPKLITLGFTFQRLWQTISDIVCNMSTTMKTETTTRKDNYYAAERFNKKIQTDIISLNKCDSCSSAMLCMKNLLNFFNTNESKYSLNERQLLRPKIYDITQFGCMLQTTTTIEEGLNRLCEKLFLKEHEIELLKKENQTLKNDIAEKCGKIAFLEKKANMLKDKCEKDILKITLLCKQNEQLIQIRNKQDCQVKTLNAVIGNLNNSIKDHNEKIFNLSRERENMKHFCTRIMKTQLGVVKLGNFLQTRLIVVEDEHLLIKNVFIQLKEVIDNVNKKLNKVTDVLNVMDIKISELSKQDIGDVSVLKLKLQEFKKELMKRSEVEAVKDVSKQQNKNSFQVKGNPVEDLTRQLEENNATIKKLENENIKLESIISKLNCLKK